jgi:hypothetical protein
LATAAELAAGAKLTYAKLGPALQNREGPQAAAYDCVVIGGGLRLPPKSLALFETVVNIIHKSAPNAAIAFNTRPEDTAVAAARQLKAD